MYPAPGPEEQYPPAHMAYPPQPPPHAMGYPPAGGQALHVQSPATRPWSTGLCDCCDDAGNCCLTFCCPCVTFGRIAEIVDRGSTSCGASGALYALIMYLTGCAWVYSFFYRTKMRQQYGLPEGPCNDCLVHCCCESCALCQEYRELRSRGFDMDIGWYGNQDGQARAGATAPPAPQGGMAR